jgi:hypothetical protein
VRNGYSWSWYQRSLGIDRGKRGGVYIKYRGGAHEQKARLPHTSALTTIMSVPPPKDLMSMFVNGTLKPGKYKVQNLTGQTYLEILEDSRELCCRPGTVLSPQDALVCDSPKHLPNPQELQTYVMISQWDFQVSGSGYKIKKAPYHRSMDESHCVINLLEVILGRPWKARSVL